MQTSNLNVNNTESDHATAIFRQFEDAIISTKHTAVKTSTKIILISYSGKKLQRCHCHKKLPSLLLSQQHFTGIFASEPMTLPQIDHVSFFAEHA